MVQAPAPSRTIAIRTTVRMTSSDPSDARDPAERNFSDRGGRRRPSRGVSLTAAILFVSGPAVAVASPAVELTGDAPFDRDQLVAALAVRMPARDVTVHVMQTADGVIVAVGGNARVVALDGQRGEAAARLVALAASDLVLDDLAIAPTAAPGDVPERPLAPTSPRRGPTTVGIVGGAAGGWDGVLGGITLDVAVRRGAWITAIDVGAVALIDAPIDLTGAVIRLGVGRNVGWLDVRLSATAVPILVSA